METPDNTLRDAQNFTPAFPLLWAYDLIVAAFTRESTWRLAHAALGRGGELHIGDYGLQRTWLMRMLFRIVQRVDGYENTQPSAEASCRSSWKKPVSSRSRRRL